jgi:hypothetical protein
MCPSSRAVAQALDPEASGQPVPDFASSLPEIPRAVAQAISLYLKPRFPCLKFRAEIWPMLRPPAHRVNFHSPLTHYI